jgi:hypothetical protein
MQGVRLRTGYTMVELFRKYLWYLLRERKFDQVGGADKTRIRQPVHQARVTSKQVISL